MVQFTGTMSLGKCIRALQFVAFDLVFDYINDGQFFIRNYVISLLLVLCVRIVYESQPSHLSAQHIKFTQNQIVPSLIN